MFGGRTFKARFYLARAYGAGRTAAPPPDTGRPVTQNFLNGIYPQESDAVLLILLTIEEPNLPGPLRVVRNTEQISSRGLPYIPYPFEITLPDDTESDSERTLGLTIDNVSREISQAIQLATEAPVVTLEVVVASAPDVVEAGPFVLEMQRVTFNSTVVTASLAFQNILDEPHPGYSFTPGDFPALFG